MSATDVMLAELQGEAQQQNAFIDALVEGARKEERDLNSNERELMKRHRTALESINEQLGEFRETARVANDSRERLAQIQGDLRNRREVNDRGGPPVTVEYRSAGEYVIDRWQAGLGSEEARERLNIYHRVAAHQTTADNLGVIPQPVVGSVLNFIDTSRPIVSALGPMSVPGGRFIRPKVTQHTSVAAQSAEKGELASQKMLITEVEVAMVTYGGYVNVSRQNIDWSVPSIMDIVINDLAGQYAKTTETVTATAVATGSTAQTPVITATSTAAEVTAAVWKAAGASYTAMQGSGRLILAVSPDMMGAIGALFPPINPQGSQSSGFSAGSFGSGPQGAVSGVQVVMSAGLASGKAFMINTAAAEVYEQRLGSLQVTEPSVLGVQVAYAGYFAPVVLAATGIIKLTA
jgi:HK97 family phage major capsid protein